jgi:type IX secretion system PorP/SprF family membrane protein
MMKNLNIKIVSVFVFLLLVGKVNAQRIHNNSFFVQNPFAFNPAYVGVYDGLQAVVQAGTYMQGNTDTPRSGLIGINAAMKGNMGLGSYIVSEQVGAFENFTFNISGSYKTYFADKHYLSLGLGGSFNRQSLNVNRLNLNRFVDLNDATLQTDFYDASTVKFEAGAWYVNNNFEAGITFPYLYESGGNFQCADFIAMASYLIAINNSKLTIKPSVLFQTIPLRGDRFDGTLIAEWDNSFWIQTGYRSNNTAIIGAGFRLNELVIGYNFGIPSGALSNVYNNSHEVLLMLNLKRVVASSPTPDSNSGRLK